MKLAIIAGDGIGPEVVGEAVNVLDEVRPGIQKTSYDLGARRYHATNEVLHGALAYLECRPWREYEGGDHTLFVGEVGDLDYRDGDALAFHSSDFTSIVQEQLGIEGLL